MHDKNTTSFDTIGNRRSRMKKLSLISIAVIFVIGYLLHYLSGMSLWISVLIVAAGVFVNGLIAEWEDNRPGGFNNPSSEENERQL